MTGQIPDPDGEAPVAVGTGDWSATLGEGVRDHRNPRRPDDRCDAADGARPAAPPARRSGSARTGGGGHGNRRGRVADPAPAPMIMAPGMRKLALTVHVAVSVGWLGAVVSYLVLAVAGITSQDAAMVRAAYLAMDRIVWLALIPMNLASLLTGLVSSLGTSWGLVRHYWVLFKLLLNGVATVVLLMYTREIALAVSVASKAVLSTADFEVLRDPSHLAHSAAGLLILVIATALAVYKPRGLTGYGRRTPHDRRQFREPDAVPTV